MRKMSFILFLIVLFASSTSFAYDIPDQDPSVPFRLFNTENMWTFLLLDTTDGRIWQLQFDIEGEDRFTTVLSDLRLVDSEELLPGRFTLYPTTNIYTFILLDQYNGRTWQVQWSHDYEDRLLIPIL